MANTAPTLIGFAPAVTFAENAVNATPALLDPDVIFADVEGNFDGGMLTVSGLLAEDRVAIRNQGTGAGEIGVSGSDVTYAGTVIGSFAGGAGATFTVTFNAAATSAAVDALIQNLTYANFSDIPSPSRTLVLNVTDALGAGLGQPATFTELVGAANPYEGLDVGILSTPALADIDGDGDQDAVVGAIDSVLHTFRNNGDGSFTELVGAANPFSGWPSAFGWTPTFVDVDGDGDLDLVGGEYRGALRTFRNNGGGSFTELFGAANPFHGIGGTAHDYSAPDFADLDGDGDEDLVLGQANGSLRYFRNDGGAFTELAGDSNPFNGLNGGDRSKPATVDLDGDGDMDAVIGNAEGAVRTFRNDGGAFTELAGSANPFNLVGGVALVAPTFADLDGDGDFDLVAGGSDGQLRSFENVAQPGQAMVVEVTPGNDPPVMAGVATDAAFTENGARVILSDALTLSDDQDTNLEGATVWIADGLAAGDLLSVDGADAGTAGAISWSYDAPSGTLSFTGSAPLADYQALLRRVAFESSSDNPGSTRTIGWTVNDGDDASAPQTTSIEVTEMNDAPYIDLDSDTPFDADTTGSYTDGDPPTLVAPRAIVTDPDMPADYGGYTLTVEIVENGTADDQLVILGTGTGPGEVSVTGGDVYYEGVLVGSFTGGNDGSALVISFNSNAGSSAVDRVTASIAFSISSSQPSALERWIMFTIDDGAESDSTASATAIISVTALNDTPELTGLEPSVTFGENLVNAAPQLLDADVTLTDDESNFEGGVLVVSGMLAEDEVAIRDQGSAPGQIGVSGSDVTYGGTVIGAFESGEGLFGVIFNAEASAEAIEALIQNLTYANGSNAPTASRTLIINVIDANGADLGLNVPQSAEAHFAPRIAAPSPFDTVFVDGNAAPAFADLDGDGDLDLVVGDGEDRLRAFENEDGVFNELFGFMNPFDDLNLGDNNAPAFIDIDGDTDLDLVVGGEDGRLQLFGNEDGEYFERTGAANPFWDLDLDNEVTPAFVDLDDDGDLDLVIGGEEGPLRVFENDGGVFTELTGSDNPFEAINAEYYTSPTFDVLFTAPSFVDLDGDGDMDLVVGDYSGTLRAFENDGGAFTYMAGDDDPFDGATVYGPARPSFVDFDGDGDLDAVVGQGDGMLRTFENGPPHGLPIVVNVTPENDAPLLDLDVFATPDPDTSASFTEGAPPVTIAPFAVFTDPDQPANYGGYVVTVEISQNGEASDALSIANIGTGPGEIGVSGSDLLYQGVVVGSFTGGTNGDPLVITFNDDACACSVELTLANILYSNASQDPSELARTVTFTLDDGDGGVATALATIEVAAVDDLPVANDDAASTPENAIVSGNVLGNDSDPDDPLEIAEVNGQAANVGAEIILASGAKLTLNADGTYSYNPNGRFNTLTSTSTGQIGAVNTSATDSFTYKLVNGDTATVTITIEGVGSPEDRLEGDSSDNVISGTPNVDIFQLQQGGEDTAQGLESNDGFYFGAELSTGDVVDGAGANNDQLIIQGDYSSLYTFGESNMINIEVLAILRGADTRFGDAGTNLYDYNLATVDANVAAGRRLTVDFAGLAIGEDVIFDGSAETDGGFTFYAGKGDDYLIGGAGADLFVFRSDGRFTGADRVDGRGGNDELALRGDYAGANAVTFSATTMTDVEVLVILSGQNSSWGRFAGEFDYDVTTHDANVAAGRRLTVDAAQLLANESLVFDGSAETDGTFRIFGGKSNDVLIAGAGNDTICGGQGGDMLTGGAGADLFAYKTALDSTLANADGILDYASTLGDRIDLSKIDAMSGGTSSDAFAFIGSAAFSNVQGQLRAEDLGGGIWQVQGDVDGDGAADLHFFVTVTDGDPITAADFFL